MGELQPKWSPELKPSWAEYILKIKKDRLEKLPPITFSYFSLVGVR